jgi:hypothetical protein
MNIDSSRDRDSALRHLAQIQSDTAEAVRLLNFATAIRYSAPGESHWEVRMIRARDAIQAALRDVRNLCSFP